MSGMCDSKGAAMKISWGHGFDKRNYFFRLRGIEADEANVKGWTYEGKPVIFARAEEKNLGCISDQIRAFLLFPLKVDWPEC